MSVAADPGAASFEAHRRALIGFAYREPACKKDPG
jgi:hypothetical protein